MAESNVDVSIVLKIIIGKCNEIMNVNNILIINYKCLMGNGPMKGGL